MTKNKIIAFFDSVKFKKYWNLLGINRDFDIKVGTVLISLKYQNQLLDIFRKHKITVKILNLKISQV